MSRLKRENGGSRQHKPGTPNHPSFGLLLKRAVEDSCPKESFPVTYDDGSRLQAYYYQQPREYTC